MQNRLRRKKRKKGKTSGEDFSSLSSDSVFDFDDERTEWLNARAIYIYIYIYIYNARLGRRGERKEREGEKGKERDKKRLCAVPLPIQLADCFPLASKLTAIRKFGTLHAERFS